MKMPTERNKLIIQECYNVTLEMIIKKLEKLNSTRKMQTNLVKRTSKQKTLFQKISSDTKTTKIPTNNTEPLK